MKKKVLLCESCGAALKKGAKFCSKCGAKVVEKRYCANCGAELDPDDLFCGACGTPVDDAGGAEPAGGAGREKSSGQAAVKVVKDSGYYSLGIEKPHVNTPDHYFFETEKGEIARLDKSMAGKTVPPRNEYGRGGIQAMGVVDGALAVLMEGSFGGEDKCYLEYYTFDLEYIRSEALEGLKGPRSSEYFVDGSHMFYIVYEYAGQTEENRKYYHYKVISYDILSKRSTEIPVVVKDLQAESIERAWCDQSNLYLEIAGVDTKADKDADNYKSWFIRVDAKYKATEILADRYNRDGDKGYPLFFDFEKDVMWTYLTDAECKRFGLIRNEHSYKEGYLGARKIRPGAPVLKEYPIWKITDKFAMEGGYFDGEFMFSDRGVYDFYTCTQSGDMIKWPNYGGGKTVNSFVWNDKIIGDLHAHYRYHYYPKQLEYEEGIVIDGVER